MSGIARKLAGVTKGKVSPRLIVIPTGTSPFIHMYKWTYSGGLTTKFANPTQLPTSGAGNEASWNADGTRVVWAGSGSSSQVVVYNMIPTGFSTRRAVATVAGNANAARYSPGGSYVVGHNTTPFISAYRDNNTKFSNPAVLPIGLGHRVAFSPSGNAVALQGAGRGDVYAWSDTTGFGTRYANPANRPQVGHGVDFHPLGNAIVFSSTSSSISTIAAYAWSDATGFGAKFANPVGIPVGFHFARSVRFHPDGDAVGWAISLSPFMLAYRWTASGWGTKYADPVGSFPSTALGFTFAPTGDAAFLCGPHPGVKMWQWSSATGFIGSAFNPGTVINNAGVPGAI